MEDVPVVGAGPDRRELQEVLSSFDAPAYVRRARRVEAAYEQLLNRCRRQRHALLSVTRTRLGLLKALAGDWAALRPLLADDSQLDALTRLDADLAPKLRAPPAPTASARALRRALADLADSIAFFNRRWARLLDRVDLGPVNELRDGYNRFYVLEKECAVRSPAVARQGFRPLSPLTRADLAAALPPLPAPQTRR
jgi:hypothetical protein